MPESVLFLVGNFPPPVHGAAVVNASILSLLQANQIEPVVLNTSPRSLSRSISVRLQRITRVLVAAGTIARLGARTRSVIYISMSGGYGQLSELIVLLTGRLVGARIVAHHHSYAYLATTNALTAACVRVIGSTGLHVVLCEDMGKKLQAAYSGARNLLVVSNAVFTADESADNEIRKELRTVAYFSNISEAKGILYFLQTAAHLEARAPEIRLVIAGEFENREIRNRVDASVARLSNVEYLGPKYGVDKTEFLAGVDVLLFPSVYKNKAEPLTILEASAHAIPVIASDRGCIGGMLASNNGLVIPSMDQFAEIAASQIIDWMHDQEMFRRVSASARAAFISRRAAHMSALASLIREIGGFPFDESAPKPPK